MNITDRTVLHCSLIPGIGPATIQKILALDFQNDITQIYVYNTSDWIQKGFSLSVSQKLDAGLKDYSLLDKELDLLHKYAITWVSCVDEQYPDALKEIHVPPVGLYIQGNTDIFSDSLLAIVGSRKADMYAKNALENIIPHLVQSNIPIVSGGAIGVDTLAHSITLKNHGKTIAVIGSGLLNPYPKQNKKLFKDIIQNGGCIISPFSLQSQALPGNFPARNRIISGLSKGTFVVQAARKSGAMITAHYALEQGRDVFALPGSILNPLSYGCHSLLRNGAKIVQTAEDILEEFGMVSSFNEAKKENVSRKKEQRPQTISDIIISYCNNPISIDELQNNLNISLLELQQLLFNLQLEGKIEQNHMGWWQVI